MADQKITELTELTTPISSDILPIIDDPAGSPVSKKVTMANIAANLTGVPSAGVAIDEYGTATYDNVQDWSSATQSAGLISGGAITDATGGNINVAAGSGFAKTTDSEIGVTISLDWSARSGITIAQGSKHTVYIDYDASPQVLVTTDPASDLDYTTKFSIGSVFYDGTTMHILNEAGTRIYNLGRRVHHRARRLRGFERANGLVIADESTRYFSITNGVIYAGLNPISITGVDTTGADTFTTWYYDGDLGTPAWVSNTGASQLDNVQYNAVATGLANLTSNRYGVHWIYMDVDDHCNVLYGQGNYTLTQAQNSVLPTSIPSLLDQFAILVARVIVQEGATEIVELSTAFNGLFTLSTPTDHGELGGLADDDHTQYSLTDGSRAYTGTGAGFKDEDDMASDSATAVASQQSIKKYVDDNAGGGGFSSRARAYRVTSNQAVTENTLTKIEFNGESYDGDGEWDSTTNFRFTATESGYYLVTAAIYVDVDGGGSCETHIYVDGSTVSQKNEQYGYDVNRTLDISDIIYVAAESYIEIWAKIYGGNERTVLLGEGKTFVSIHRLS